MVYFNIRGKILIYIVFLDSIGKNPIIIYNKIK
jgi:hypothetical protein